MINFIVGAAFQLSCNAIWTGGENIYAVTNGPIGGY